MIVLATGTKLFIVNVSATSSIKDAKTDKLCSNCYIIENYLTIKTNYSLIKKKKKLA